MMLVGYFLAITVVTLGYGIYWNSNQPPHQPFDFSHRIHLTKVGLYCHSCHESNYNPTIPSVDKCISCHGSEKANCPEIKELSEDWQMKEPAPWVKIHQLPKHVYFTHKRHLRTGHDCEECHGRMESVESAQQVRSLEMAWCLRCHEVNNADRGCLTCHK